MPNENHFKGIIGYGTNDKKENIDFNNKVDTIIGLVQHYLSYYFRKKSWKRVNEIYTKTMKHFNNELNHNMSKIHAVTEDILIYCYYGLLDIYCDEI